MGEGNPADSDLDNTRGLRGGGLMTFYTNSYIQETPQTFSDYEAGFSIDADSGLGVEGFEEYEWEGELGISEDVFIGSDTPSDGSSGLHAKVGQLLEALAGSQLPASEKSEIRSALEALQGKINTLAAMSPERYSVEIGAIHSQIGNLETRIL
ncbi:MAG TPA: hypothetical protein VJR29_04015, partial [bacterium]|nr:hypothetical protein [bacterium]